jgi:AcrR family transcriptional regulator
MNNTYKLSILRVSMAEEKVNRRIQRTRQLLQKALLQLIDEKGYDAISIQDITEKANLGRSTFYLHYPSKDALLLDHHAEFAAHLKLWKLSREELLSDEPQATLMRFLKELSRARDFYLKISRAKDSDFIMRGVRQQMIHNLSESLRIAFPDLPPNKPLEILTTYIVGAQLALIDWWINQRNSYSADEVLRSLHQLQRAAIRDAYGIQA